MNKLYKKKLLIGSGSWQPIFASMIRQQGKHAGLEIDLQQ
jgi:hypothetical protein